MGWTVVAIVLIFDSCLTILGFPKMMRWPPSKSRNVVLPPTVYSRSPSFFLTTMALLRLTLMQYCLLEECLAAYMAYGQMVPSPGKRQPNCRDLKDNQKKNTLRPLHIAVSFSLQYLSYIYTMYRKFICPLLFPIYIRLSFVPLFTNRCITLITQRWGLLVQMGMYNEWHLTRSSVSREQCRCVKTGDLLSRQFIG